jgi:precorrin-6B methylase 2
MLNSESGDPLKALREHFPRSSEDYLEEGRVVEEQERLQAFASVFDDWTFRHLDNVGVAEGWSCWEIGAGCASVVQWLSRKVGPTGNVVATDADGRLLQVVRGGNVRVRIQNISTKAMPPGSFDLVHARLALSSMRYKYRAIEHMVHALKPGGWLVVEEEDYELQPLACLDPINTSHGRANEIRVGISHVLEKRGVDLALGRRLPKFFRDAGLSDVSAEAYFPVADAACRRLELSKVRLFREDLIRNGHALRAEVTRHIGLLEKRDFDLTQPPVFTAWGRRVGEIAPAIDDQ